MTSLPCRFPRIQYASSLRWVGLLVLLPALLVWSGCGGSPTSVLASTPTSDSPGSAGGTDETAAPTTGGATDTPTGGSGTTAAGATVAASLRTQAELISDLSAIGDLQRSGTESKSQQITSALKRVKAYRLLMGLRTDVITTTTNNELADAAADVCMRLGMLTHTPSRPSGLSDAQYALAQQGAGESNLASGYPGITIPQSIEFYMDDSDSGNIDRLGHRRWILSPLLTQIGFGLSSNAQFTATHVFPESQYMSACFGAPAALQSWEYILYPRWGYMPIEYMAAADVAWSLSLRGDKYHVDGVSAGTISVRPADHESNPTGAALAIDYFNRSTDNYGCQQPVVIFRPVGLSLSAGQRYRVTIAGVTDAGGHAVPIDYWVEFFSAGVTVTP